MRGAPKLVLVSVTLIALYWPGIQDHWKTAKDPYFVPFDAVQYIPPFFKFAPSDPIPTTYVKEYYLNAVCPVLYKWLTILGAQMGDVRHVQLATMYVLYIAFIATMGRIGWMLGGAVLSFAVVALTITAWIFIGLGFLGGAPRMFAYPLISLVLYALIRGRPYPLMVATVLGGLLYPVVAMIGGLCLTCWLFLKPLSSRSTVAHWSWFRRLATLAVTGTLTLAGLLPMMFGSVPYGRRIVESNIPLFPEVGPSGGYLPMDRLPFKLFGSEWTSFFLGTLYSHADPLLPWFNMQKTLDPITWLFVLAVMGLIVAAVIVAAMRLAWQDKHRDAATRLMSFFVVCLLLHILAWLGSPYLFIPNRYFMFSLPFIITLLFPWSVYIVISRMPPLQSFPGAREVVFLLLVGLYLTAFGGRGNVDLSGFSVKTSSQPLFTAIATLPKNAIVAGWPIGEVQKVEYVTRRNVFVTLDIHQLFYLDFVKVMRERMDALFDAYLSTDAKPLYRLRQQFGITHLLVETRNFTDPNKAPEYFAPWQARIAPRLAEIRGKEYLMDDSLHRQAAIFNRNGLILLDLTKLP